MDINDAVGKGAKEFALEDAHEAGEDNEVDLLFLEGGDEASFSIFVELGAEFSRRDVDRFEVVIFGEGENASILDIGGDHDDFHGGTGAGAIPGERIEVRAFA